jgi:putative transposase
MDADALLADKGYDANHLIEKMAERGTEIVIPPKRDRRVQRHYDADLYKERNKIERFFNKLKQFRRVATRYDKLLANFMGFGNVDCRLEVTHFAGIFPSRTDPCLNLLPRRSGGGHRSDRHGVIERHSALALS